MKETVTKDYLDEIAHKYHLDQNHDDKSFDQIFHKLCFNWASSFFNKSPKVLEMGFGEGNVTKELLEIGCDVDIVEGSSLLVNHVKRIFDSKVNVYHSLFSDFIPHSKYDFIFATNILEHVDDPVETLSNISKWCTENTKIILTVPNCDSIHRRLAVLMGLQEFNDSLSPRDNLVGHKRVYSYKSIVKQLKSCGFNIIAEKGFLLKVLPNSLMKDLSPNLIRAFYDISDQVDIGYTADMGFILKKDMSGEE